MGNEEKNKNKVNFTTADVLTSNTQKNNPLTHSAIDLATLVQPKNYLTAIDYITAQSGKLNAITNQINFLTSPTYQPSILTAVTEVQNHLSALSTIQSYLPKVDHLNALMDSFYDFMTPLESRKQNNLLENQKLAELRDWLLPMLMNGQVIV